MYKKLFLTIITAALLGGLTGCNKSSGEGESLNIASEEVTGENSTYVAPITDAATLVADDNRVLVRLPLEVKRATSGKIRLQENWTIDLVDATGLTIQSLECKEGDKAALETLLNQGVYGDEKDIVFSSSFLSDKGIADKIKEKAVRIRLNTKPWSDQAPQDDTDASQQVD